MYNHQEACGRAISNMAISRGSKFDYVISAREDVYFFLPFDLGQILAGRQKCDLVTKDCLTWNGINLRLQLISGRIGERWLTSRYTHYSHLSSTKRAVSNPEQFEMDQAKSMNMRTCAAPVDVFPVAVSRFMGRDRFCFIDPEVSGCVPHVERIEAFIQQHMCTTPIQAQAQFSDSGSLRHDAYPAGYEDDLY